MILMSFGRSAGLLLVPALLAASACTPQEESTATVVTAFYALEYAAGEVAGGSHNVTNLTTPGVDAHDLELTPRQVASLASAELVVYLKGFQPAVDDAIANSGATKVLDVAEAARLLDVDDGHGERDPHFWLDPKRLADVGDAIADRLGEDGSGLRAELTAIDDEFRAGLADCERDTFVTTHAAFAYLADAYGLTQVGITGISPNEEPSPARIAEVDDLARRLGITTIFYEPLDSDQLAKSMAGDLGLLTAVLDPLEGIGPKSPGDDYPTVMRANLEALRSANGCR